MYYKGMSKENFIWVVKTHLERGYTAEKLSELSYLPDTRNGAKLLGIKPYGKNKIDLWIEIVNKLESQ